MGEWIETDEMRKARLAWHSLKPGCELEIQIKQERKELGYREVKGKVLQKTSAVCIIQQKGTLRKESFRRNDLVDGTVMLNNAKSNNLAKVLGI